MSGFAKREGKDDLLMYTLIPTVFSLFFLPLSFFLSVLFTLGCLLVFLPLVFSLLNPPLPRCLSLSKCLP